MIYLNQALILPLILLVCFFLIDQWGSRSSFLEKSAKKIRRYSKFILISLINLLENAKNKLCFHFEKILTEENKNNFYNPLSPTSNAENSGDYLDAIKWALDNRKTIRNIAITGPYGSGKSSIIQTFQKTYRLNSNYKFLNISLATFKEDKEIDLLNKDDNKNNEALRLIELSILQQIFYHESDSNIPDSRFSKVEKRNRPYLLASSIVLCSAFISYLYLAKPKTLEKFTFFDIKENYSLRVFAVLICFLTLFYILYKLMFWIKGVVISKVSFSNAEIEIDKKISKSILNRHVDEILYFFEMTEYNVVVIEDLDRFEQTEVFTKLRELNLLLNNSKKIKKEIVFLYAIKDEMFKNKDRAKFFDFIIPIIPVINSSNSSEQLLKIIEKNKYVISSGLVEDIALFVDDMRLLYNIMNEYYIYSKKIDSNLSQDKLLAIIVYKNIYPSDFSILSKGDGELFKVLMKKTLYVASNVSRINKQIVEEKNVLIKGEENSLNNLIDLRRIYVNKIIEKIISVKSISFYSFFISNQSCTIAESLTDDKFDYIRNNFNTITFQSLNQYPYGRYNLGFSFSDVEKEVDASSTYADKLNSVIQSQKHSLDQKRKKIQALELERSNVKKKKIKDLIDSNDIDSGNFEEGDKQKELLSLLIRNGYIDEDYLDYLSIFYEGSLSRQDYDFLIKIKTQARSEYDFKLDKVENLIKKINIHEFEKDTVLNFDLLNFIIENTNFLEQRSKMIARLANENDSSLRFINEFVDRSAFAGEFVALLCKQWPNMWGCIQEQGKHTREKKDYYLELIIKFADVDDIVKTFKNFKDDLNREERFLLICDDYSKINEIVSKLKLKIKAFGAGVEDVVLDHVYKTNAYEINQENLKFFIGRNANVNLEEFNLKNYRCIRNSGLNELISYVEDNFEEYIEHTYLKMDLNRDDPADYIHKILNNEKIDLSLKKHVLEHVNTFVEIIDEIAELEVLEMAFDIFKIAPKWKNVMDMYFRSENSFKSVVVKFINNNKIMKILAKEVVDKDYPDKAKGTDFIYKMYLENGLSLDSYKLVILALPYRFPKLQFEALSIDKVEFLITANKISINSDNYILIKEHFFDLRLLFLAQNTNEFINNIDAYSIDEKDMLDIFISNKFALAFKEKLIENKGYDLITGSYSLVDCVADILLKEEKVNIQESIIKTIIIKNRLAASKKIEIFNKYYKVFLLGDIEAFLVSLPEPYASISEKGKAPVLDYSIGNYKFAENLREKVFISSFRRNMTGRIQIATFKK